MQLDDHVVDDESVIYKGTLIYPDYSGSGKYWKGVSKGKGGRFYARITGLKIQEPQPCVSAGDV